MARLVHLEALPRLVKSATMQELVIARDSAKTFRAFAQAYAPFAQRRRKRSSVSLGRDRHG